MKASAQAVEAAAVAASPKTLRERGRTGPGEGVCAQPRPFSHSPLLAGSGSILSEEP